MSALLHLPARVPNYGAVALFRWLAWGPSLAAAIAQIEAVLGTGMVQRLISGEVVPGEDEAREIAAATGGRVVAPYWNWSPSCWWFTPSFAAVRSRGATDAALRDMPRASSLPSPPRRRRAA